MQKTLLSMFPAIALTAMSLAPISASASGYILDSDGKIVKDGSGGCTRDIDWKKDIPDCGGEPMPKPVAAPVKAEPKPVMKPVVAAVVVENAPAAFVGFFALDKAILSAEAEAKLDVYATYLQKHPAKRLSIKGHTDSLGTHDYNMVLSAQRADAVKTYLSSKGVASNRMDAAGLGESDPVSDNATAAGRAQNRRVVLELLD